MLYRSNILALVGGGNKLAFPQNKVIFAVDLDLNSSQVVIWDDAQEKLIGELAFKSSIISVKLRPDALIVVLDERVIVTRFL